MDYETHVADEMFEDIADRVLYELKKQNDPSLPATIDIYYNAISSTSSQQPYWEMFGSLQCGKRYKTPKMPAATLAQAYRDACDLLIKKFGHLIKYHDELPNWWES